MKRPRSKPAASPSPRTDAEALLDIVEWSAKRPAWQRDALRLLLQHSSVSQPQADQLYNAHLEDKPAAAPITPADVRSPRAQAGTVTLKAVVRPEDVNALASDQSLSFEKSGLTIVYGDNGAGKSGYARILKHACRARMDARDAGILPNIDTPAPGTPRATINYIANGQNRQFSWQIDQASPPDLSAISVFDATTAHVYVDGTNEIAYVPTSLALLQRLAQIADTLRDRAKKEKATVEAQTPVALKTPPINAHTAVARALGSLKADSDPAALETLATLNDSEQAELAQLKKDFASDPTRTAVQLGKYRDDLLRFCDSLNSLCAAAGPASLDDIRTLHIDSIGKRAAADVAATERFATEPLPHVGSDVWRTLWEAARAYATREAQPSAPFPPNSTTQACLLCQQPLSDAAVDRFTRFEAFVRDDTKAAADRAERLYTERLASLREAYSPISRLRTQLAFISDVLQDGTTMQAVRMVSIQALWQLRTIIRRHREPTLVIAEARPDPALQAINDLSARLLARQNALTASGQSTERQKLQARLDELEARAWLSTMLPDVKAEIARKAEIQKMERVVTATETRAITQKASQLAEALVTDSLRARFNHELSDLGISHLSIELNKEPSQGGAARYRVRLVRKPNAAVGTVLSEGEHRCVALAAFLTELATLGNNSTIIFDDPVSSLDHLHRNHVAARLAAEAKNRQVIVLTHDIAFLMLLHQAAMDAQSHVGFRCVARGSEFAGYCTQDPPHHARPVDDVLRAIERDVGNKKVQWERGLQAEWRTTVRSALEQLRECWERAVEEIISPVLKRLVHKVDTANLAKLTVLELRDCDAMREGYGACSELLHSVADSLNPKLPKPDDINAHISKLQSWLAEIKQRQAKQKAT